MIRAGIGIAAGPDAASAARQACEAAGEAAGGASAALVFAALGPGADPRALLDAAVSILGAEAVVGASAHGLLAAGRELEGPAAVGVLALSGLEAHPFLLPDLRGHEAEAGREIAAQLGGDARPEDLVVLLPDPRAADAAALLCGVGEALAPACVVGAGAADPVADSPLQWCGRDLETGALAGVVLRGPRPPRVGITQACRPATDWLTVTRAQGHWVVELDGRPALEVYREVARGPLAEDLRRAAAFVLAVRPVDGGGDLAAGAYLVRNVVGFAPEEEAFAVPERVKPGQRIALALREPETARDDLKRMLERLSGERPAAGLYFDCCARAGGFLGPPGLEAGYLERAFGTAPVLGMFGSCEIGPLGGRPELLTYTGVLALLDDEPPAE